MQELLFEYAALNVVDMFVADIRNKCLQEPTSEKRCITYGLYFGLDNIVKIAIKRRGLHGGKAAGRNFMNNVRLCMTSLDFKPFLDDPCA